VALLEGQVKMAVPNAPNWIERPLAEAGRGQVENNTRSEAMLATDFEEDVAEIQIGIVAVRDTRWVAAGCILACGDRWGCWLISV